MCEGRKRAEKVGLGRPFKAAGAARAEVNEWVEGRDSELMGEWVWWEGGHGGGKL